jgi:hypothetical protein
LLARLQSAQREQHLCHRVCPEKLQRQLSLIFQLSR